MIINHLITEDNLVVKFLFVKILLYNASVIECLPWMTKLTFNASITRENCNG
jgi:hypothetical protein